MKRQIVVIHGGDSFKTRSAYLSFLKNFRIDFKRYLSGGRAWKNSLGKVLGKNFEVILPMMPNGMDAKFIEWKIWFEKFIPHLRPGVVLIGHSLGGLFLAKYLSECRFPKKIRATLLVAAPLKDGDFTEPKSLKKLIAQGGELFLYHSKDDHVVPFADFEKYRDHLKTATTRIFSNRGHFNQPTLPELVKDIKNLFS